MNERMDILRKYNLWTRGDLYFHRRSAAHRRMGKVGQFLFAGLYEEYELFISGSNSRMLSGELATLLSGRYVQFPVYPFSYQEYAEIRHLEQNRESYMNTGGIPELFVLPEKQEV